MQTSIKSSGKLVVCGSQGEYKSTSISMFDSKNDEETR
jgi:hypothetical protein